LPWNCLEIECSIWPKWYHGMALTIPNSHVAATMSWHMHRCCLAACRNMKSSGDVYFNRDVFKVAAPCSTLLHVDCIFYNNTYASISIWDTPQKYVFEGDDDKL
jgi:hypothetical protein